MQYIVLLKKLIICLESQGKYIWGIRNYNIKNKILVSKSSLDNKYQTPNFSSETQLPHV